MGINERFERVIEDLYETNQYLSNELTKLGYPKIVENSFPSTAGVSWDDTKKKVVFLFDKDFEASLSDEEFSFVVCHEAMHLINMHIFLFRDEVKRLEKKGKNNLEINSHIRKLNIASDAVVNDSLINLYGQKKLNFVGHIPLTTTRDVKVSDFLISIGEEVPVPLELFQSKNPQFLSDDDIISAGSVVNIPCAPVYGKNIVKVDTFDMTTMDVFSLLEDSKGSDSHDWSSFLNKDGTLKKEFVDKIKDFIDGGMDNSMLSDVDAAMIDEMKEKLEGSGDGYASKAGKGIESSARRINHLDSNSLNWGKLLIELTNSKKVKDNWNRPNRKLISVYPDVIIPSFQEEEKEEIFVAIDTSGSINKEACTLFVNVVRNTPKRFKVKAITFDTKCHEYDIRSGNPVGGGGTNFRIIEEYIQKNFKKYPKAIFVLTDGDGTTISPEKPKRWCWLLYGYCTESFLGDMKRYKIMELLK